MSKVFIVGTGPSLAKTNLMAVESAGYQTWTSGEIQLLYPTTRWRPTRYWWTDHPQDAGHWESLMFHLEQGYPMWVRRDVFEMLTGEYRPLGDWYPGPLARVPGHVKSWDYCVKHNAGLVRDDITGEPDIRRPEGWHPEDWPVLCKYGSGLNCMMQQACIEGHEIVLVGCDLGFKGRERDCKADPDHFHPDYNRRHASEERAQIDNETHVDFHMHALRYCQAHGVRIVNATIGGQLEVYPRVSLADEL
jgi:hypothetical protein